MAHSRPPDTFDPAETTAVEQRVHPRHACRCPAICRAGAASCSAVVVDASNGGFGLDGFALAASVDDIITIELGQIGTFRCRIAWKRGARAGVEFLDENSPGDAEVQDLARGLLRSQV